MARARADSGAFAAWLGAQNDIVLRALTSEADARNLTLTGLVRERLADFAEGASEEDWAHAVSAARSGDDPGRAFLSAVLARKLLQPQADES
jgi:hypothetical protein